MTKQLNIKLLMVSVTVFVVLLLTNIGMTTPILIGGTTDLLLENSGWDGKQSFQDTGCNVNWLVDTDDGTRDYASSLPYELTLLGKWEVDDQGWEKDDIGVSGEFLGSNGIWKIPNSFSGPIYYSIKAGSSKSGGGFELYYADGDLEGTWDTLGLSNKDLSHISFWTAGHDISQTNPIPEPGTMVLFSLGLLGVAGLSRKNNSLSKQ